MQKKKWLWVSGKRKKERETLHWGEGVAVHPPPENSMVFGDEPGQ